MLAHSVLAEGIGPDCVRLRYLRHKRSGIRAGSLRCGDFGPYWPAKWSRRLDPHCQRQNAGREGEHLARSPMPATAREVYVLSEGQVSPPQAAQVAAAVGQILERRHITGDARVRLTTRDGLDGPLLIQVNLQVRDKPTRMQAITAGVGDLEAALGRLDRQIVRTREPWRPRPWPDRTRRILSAVGGQPVIGRRKHVALQIRTPLEMVAVMDSMDFDVHLFTDHETGEDAVVYRAGPSGLRLARQRRMYPPGWSWAPARGAAPPVPLIVNSRPTPILTDAEAVTRISEHGLRFLFFTNPNTGRGQLLYPRYDGSLGLLTPAVRHHDHV